MNKLQICSMHVHFFSIANHVGRGLCAFRKCYGQPLEWCLFACSPKKTYPLNKELMMLTQACLAFKSGRKDKNKTTIHWYIIHLIWESEENAHGPCHGLWLMISTFYVRNESMKLLWSSHSYPGWKFYHVRVLTVMCESQSPNKRRRYGCIKLLNVTSPK